MDAGWILGWRKFFKRSKITSFIKEDFPSLKIFETGKQKTWLVRTEKTLYWILDDRTKSNPMIKRFPMNKILDSSGNVKATIKINPDKHTIIFDNHPFWYYTEKIYPNKKDIKNRMIEFLEG